MLGARTLHGWYVPNTYRLVQEQAPIVIEAWTRRTGRNQNCFSRPRQEEKRLCEFEG